MGKFKFPSAYTILFFLIAIVAVLTWIIPAGQYHMAMNEALGKEVPVAGTYAHVEANPQGLISVLMAPIAGLYDPDSGQARAIDVALFILIIGGFLGIVTKTGAIDAGIERVTTRLRGREEWMVVTGIRRDIRPSFCQSLSHLKITLSLTPFSRAIWATQAPGCDASSTIRILNSFEYFLRGSFRQSCNSILRCPSVSDGRLRVMTPTY